jgi:nucleoside 2-deoxyribosyltransferase
MIVAGGSYLEICLRPEWRRLFGSGLRAACAVARLSPGTVLHTYGSEDWLKDIELSANAFGCVAYVHSIKEAISFSYDHPLSSARQYPQMPARHAALKVEGSTVLRFGFVEGDAVVRAQRAVYDPQSCDCLAPFRSNGSEAERLAIVLNQEEARATNSNSLFDVEGLMAHHDADVVVIKCGPRGAIVHSRGNQSIEIPPYRSNSVFKIGSGDVFSAAFALYWGERGMDAGQAADYASRSVARFVDGHSLPLGEVEQDDKCESVYIPPSGKIYLAGPFFDLAQRWLIEETVRTLKGLGAEVFSPLHDVGMGLSSAEIAQADLKGLRSCSKVLALLDGVDPGTIYEVGYARALEIPVVALAERVEPEHLTMIAGSGCDVVNDFATAIYRILWTRGR